jgi:hypothetical protein
MYAKVVSDYSALPKDERRLVFFARAANGNTWGGGCDALLWAEKQGHRDAVGVVSEVYARSSGHVPAALDAYECGECGQVHYGREAADACCAFDEDFDGEDAGEDGEDGEY